jgi:peroxiredoxin
MAATPSTMIPLGTVAFDFALRDAVTGKLVTLVDFHEKPALLVMFLCNHCPFVKHVQAELVRIASDYQPRGLAIVAISSNDVQRYPDDGPDKMAEEARRAGYTFPYLFDEEQAVAKSYSAACTPDFYLFDQQRHLVYRGQLDDSRPNSGVPVTGADLRAAIDAALAGRPPVERQLPSIGCNIKWKPGNEPEYARAT